MLKLFIMLKNMKAGQIIYWFFVILLLVFGFWLRADNLGVIDFQNDEFFHLDTAKGYLETGRFVMWDFIKQEPTADYIRAFPYTWLVAQSFKVFGVSELAGRLPSLLFGFLLLPLLFYLTFKITNNKIVALLPLALFVFDNSLIWSSRICRMYSMFVFFVAIATYLIYKGLENKNNKINYYFLLSGGVFFIFSYIIHEATLLLGLGFLIYFLLNIKQKKYQVLSAISLLILISFFLINSFIAALTTNDFFTVRANPNFVYFFYPFNQLRAGALIGWFILFLGVFLWPKREQIKIYYLCLSVPITLYFVFFAERYAAKKYLLFIIPFILILFADSFYLFFKKIFATKYFYYILIISFIIIGPRFILRYESKEVHGFKTAYSYLESHYQKKEPVLIQGARSYYLTNPNINYISLKANKEFTLSELKQIKSANDSGWVIWPKFKEYHLRDDLVVFCQNNLDYVEELSDTNIIVYRWDHR